MTNKKVIEQWRKVILQEQYEESIKELEKRSVDELIELCKEETE